MHTFTQNAKVQNTADIPIQVVNAATVNGAAWLGMANYDRAALICHMTTAAAAIATFGFNQATDNAGASSKPIAGFTDAMVQADSGECHVIEIKATDLAGNFDYIRPYVTESGVQDANCCAFVVRWRSRYAGATMPA